MHLLTWILMIIVGSVVAATKGDFSGLAFIGRILLWLGMFLFVVCIFGLFIGEDGLGIVFLVSVITGVLGLFLAATDS